MSFGNMSAERQAVEMTYEDTAVVYRTISVRGQNAITASDLSVIYSEIVCALSYSGSENSRQSDAQNNIDYDAALFAGPEYIILPGDKIIVKRFGKDIPCSNIILNFEVIGRPVIYPTHQEIKVKDGGLA